MEAITPCIERALVDSHFCGDISPDDERRLREHLIDCATCQAYYRRRQIFARLDPEATSTEDRLARGLGFASPAATERRKPRAFPLWPLAATIALAAAVFLFLRTPHDDGFHARGGPSSVASTSTIGVYRVSDRTLLSTSGSFRPDDELAFSYENPSQKPYVMIFGEDETGRVYWFYPAWTDPAANPMAVATEAGREHVALPEAIRHRFQGSKLTIHGLFLETPQTVRDVEAALRDHRLGGMAGAVDQTTTFEVTK